METKSGFFKINTPKKEIRENYCPCARTGVYPGASNGEYDVFDYNLVQENYAGENVEGNPGNYITLGNTGSRYSAAVEARGSPMGLPLNYDHNDLPCNSEQANRDSRIPYGEDNSQFVGLGNTGNPHESFQYMARPNKFNSITPLPHNTNRWSSSYLSYLVQVPPTVRAAIQDPNNKTSYVIPGYMFDRR